MREEHKSHTRTSFSVAKYGSHTATATRRSCCPLKGTMTCRPDVAAPFDVAPGHVLAGRDALAMNCWIAGSEPHLRVWLVATRLHSHQCPLC